MMARNEATGSAGVEVDPDRGNSRPVILETPASARSTLLVATVALTASAVACGATTPRDTGGAWVGTVTTEGNVTTVINERGSVWPGSGRLIEEATIGVESGAAEYLFGEIHSIFADDERIYVADVQVPAVRMYDHDGLFLGNLGGPGHGPGEYVEPSVVAGDKERIYVADGRLRRINVYGADGEPLETWSVADYQCCFMPMYAVAPGELQIPVQLTRGPGSRYPYQLGFRVYAARGPLEQPRWVPELDFEPVRVQVEGRAMGVRFTPARAIAPLQSGGFAVGINERYRFELHDPDGRKLIVERHKDPTPLLPEEWEWWRRSSVAATRVFRQIPNYDWDGAEMPRHKPAYDRFVSSNTGEIWVAREAVSRKIPGCAEDPITQGYDVLETDPCWRADWIFDVFGADGRFLGSVGPLPRTPIHQFQRLVYVDGDLVLATTQDDLGTFSVTRFALARPE